MITWNNQTDEPEITIQDKATGMFILKHLKIQRLNLNTALNNESDLESYSADQISAEIEQLDSIIKSIENAYLIN